MRNYLFLLCLGLYVLAISCYQNSSTSNGCYPYNPLYINGTQNASELRCPKNCECQYCPLDKHGETSLKYSHNVDCSSRHFKFLPWKDTVPTDVFYYYLENNYIWTIKNDSFNTSITLEYLHLENNNLKYKTIENNSFSGLRKLRFLKLDENKQLYQLLRHWFIDLVSLEELHANHCGLSIIEKDVFKNCKNLRKLHLSSNNIISFPQTLFRNFPSLMYIFIGGNKLKNISNQAFVGSNNLRMIVVNDNSLSTISEKVGIQNLTNLELITVEYNQFYCDCNFIWFRNWIDVTNVTIEGLNTTNCYTNNHNKVYHRILDFDPNSLQCNNLIKILKIVIPSTGCSVAIVITVVLLYSYRFDIRYWKQRRRLRNQYQQLANQGPPPINGEDIRYDAFVAYNSKDQDWILQCLQPSLEERNFKLCIDYRDFMPGEAVVNNIANSVKYSRKVILVVSKNFANSEWCYFELEMARMRMFENQEDILVVILLEKVPARAMPILLHKILTKKTYIEWEEPANRQPLFWAKLEAALLTPNCHRDRLLEPRV